MFIIKLVWKLEFKDKQFDGPYEVAGIDIKNEGDKFKGVVYFPPTSFSKPYPLFIYLHGFPQIFTLQEIVKSHSFLLDEGYAFIAFNFRGYRYSQGNVSIQSQVSDLFKILEFVKKMATHNIFDLNNINLLAHDFGAYIGLIVCSKEDLINNLIIISPILDLKRHIHSPEFSKVLVYINRFLPGNVRGVENVGEFIKMTQKELENSQYKIEEFISHLKAEKIKIIVGKDDKITPLSEVESIFSQANIHPDIVKIDCMDHECILDTGEDEIDKIKEEVKRSL